MATAKYTVVYESDEGRRHKLTLVKRIVNYPDPDSRAADPPIELGLLQDDDHRLKLSHHPDGLSSSRATGSVRGRNIDLRVCPSPRGPWQLGFLGVDVWSAPIVFGTATSGFAMSSPTRVIGHNGRGELEAEALFAFHPDMESDVRPFLPNMAFPVRDDPPYIVPPESS